MMAAHKEHVTFALSEMKEASTGARKGDLKQETSTHNTTDGDNSCDSGLEQITNRENKRGENSDLRQEISSIKRLEGEDNTDLEQETYTNKGYEDAESCDLIWESSTNKGNERGEHSGSEQETSSNEGNEEGEKSDSTQETYIDDACEGVKNNDLRHKASTNNQGENGDLRQESSTKRFQDGQNNDLTENARTNNAYEHRETSDSRQETSTNNECKGGQTIIIRQESGDFRQETNANNTRNDGQNGILRQETRLFIVHEVGESSDFEQETTTRRVSWSPENTYLRPETETGLSEGRDFEKETTTRRVSWSPENTYLRPETETGSSEGRENCDLRQETSPNHRDESERSSDRRLETSGENATAGAGDDDVRYETDKNGLYVYGGSWRQETEGTHKWGTDGTEQNRRRTVRSMSLHDPIPEDLVEGERIYSRLEKHFNAVAGPSGSLDKETFRKALHVKKSFFADRLFELFDDDSSGSIDLNELLQGLRTLTKGTPSQKLHFLFRIYDVDNSGTISWEELRMVLQSCMEESSLHLSEENLDALTNVLLEDADTDHSGTISFEELQTQLEKYPELTKNLTISLAQWLMPPEKAKRTISFPRHLTLAYFQNNRVKVFFTLLFVLVNVGLYVLNAWLYRESNWYIIIARGAGMCLNFNCAFVLVMMLRKTLTFLRNTPLVRMLPFDQHVMFHKLAGYTIVFFTLIHTGANLGNAAVYVTESTQLNVAEILFTLKAGVGWVRGFAPLSGVLMDLLLLVMVICSLDFVRRSGNFEVFYWTHKLYVPFIVLNVLHGANFWKWIVGPAAIFCVELLFRLQWTLTARYGAMFIETVHLLPSGVTELWIPRPNGFQFKASDYIFLNVPAIASYEWHPFTISSAPEVKGSFSLHIRSAGHWTRKLYAHFEDIIANQSDPEQGQSNGFEARSQDRLSFRRRNSKAKKITESCMQRVRSATVHEQVYVDGPYGTGSRHIFEAEHAVLIGSGIGITPFASILQSIVCRFREAEVTCPNCAHRFAVQPSKSVMALKKVDFVWINRDQRNFEWFLTLLTKLEREQCRGGLGHVLDMHMYMTSALSKKDMKGIGLQMALDLIHQNEQTDLVTGLQTRTQPGRPDFDKLFSEICRSSSHRVKVIFCGSPLLGRTIKAACSRHGLTFTHF